MGKPTYEVGEYGSLLLCGGKGTRLSNLTGSENPKSLYKLRGKELMRYTLDLLDPEITPQVVFAVDYHEEAIKNWVTSADLPYRIEFSEQDTPGVLDAIVIGSGKIEGGTMVVCNTDEIRIGLDLGEVIRFHESNKTLATMAITSADHLYRHGVIQVESDRRISKLSLKPKDFLDRPTERGLVNAGLLVIKKGAIDLFDTGQNKDWMGIIDPLCDAGQLSAYIDTRIHYFNVGTSQEYQEADAFLGQRTDLR